MTSEFDRVIDRRSSNSLKWTTYPKDVLPLWVADMDFQAPEPIRRALHAAVEHGVLGYEMLMPRTQQVVAARMERLYGWKVAPDWVVATIGVVNGYTVAAKVLCGPAEGVVIQAPVYHMFYTLSPGLGLTQQVAPFHPTSSGNVLQYEIDFEAFAKSFHSNGARTRMFLLCHPHNPIGRVFSREELLKMAQTCLENDAIIVADEIHSELLLGGQAHVPIATLSPEIEDRTITLVAPSKTFNTCGLFCGFAIIPNAALRKRFTRAAEDMSGLVSSLGLIAAETAFSGACDGWKQELLGYLKGNRDFITRELAEKFPGTRFSVADATFLEWIDFSEFVKSGKITGSPQKYFLEKAKVAFSDGKAFGAGFENYVRLNFGAPRSVIAQALSQMHASVS
jgi:cystathionine beta-lyase